MNNKPTPETDAAIYPMTGVDIVWPEFARKLERERDDLQKAVNGLCEHIGVNPANTTLLAVEVLKIERERNEARELLASEKITRNHIIKRSVEVERERDEARERIERQKLEIVRLNGATSHAGGTPLKIALRECDEAKKQAAMWKANHDNQVSLKAMLMDRPDLGDRAYRIAELIRERDEARKDLQEIKEYGTEEINAAVDLRQKLAQALLDLDNMQDQRDLAMKVIKRLERELAEAQNQLSQIHRWIERNHADGFIDSLTFLQNLERVVDCWYDRIDAIESDARRYLRESDEAREALRKAIRFVEAYEPHSRGAEEDQNETLSIIRKALEGVK
jgi:tetratricopeptide (TPR) repeat protein